MNPIRFRVWINSDNNTHTREREREERERNRVEHGGRWKVTEREEERVSERLRELLERFNQIKLVTWINSA